jgi:hypothetical protein
MTTLRREIMAWDYGTGVWQDYGNIMAQEYDNIMALDYGTGLPYTPI